MKHDHHTVPRLYLKGFRIPHEPAFIWEYHRGTPFTPGRRADRHNPVRRALKAASVKIGYYGQYEDDLAEREERVKHLLERARTGSTQGALLTSDEKALFTDYIGLMIKRTTAGEERTKALWPAVFSQQRPFLEQLRRTAADHGRFTDALAITRLIDQYDNGMPDDLRQRTVTIPYNKLRQRIIDLPWTFLTTTGSFITSDNPVRWPEHEGLGHEYAFLTIPISTSTALFAGPPQAATLFNLPINSQDCGTAAIDSVQTMTINHLTITGAYQYVYSHECSEDIARTLG